MIRDTDRRPVICTRKNRVVKGFGPRAETLRWQEKNSEEFEDTYHQRSIVESVFSSFKCRFTASCSCKEDGNAKTAVVPQVHLLQSAVMWSNAKNTCCVSSVCCTTMQHFGARYTSPYPAARKFRDIQEIKSNKVQIK